MRRAVGGTWNVPEGGLAPALAATAVSFLLGALAGCLLSALLEGEGLEQLEAYLETFLRSAGAGGLEGPDLLRQMWATLRWPLLALVLGFTALGVLGLPLLFAVRGFLLAYSVAAFARAFGSAGCLLAFLIFGVPGCLSVPALFVLGTQGLAASCRLAARSFGEGKGLPPYGRAYFLRCGECAAALGLCVCLECFAVPVLVSGAAGAVLGG